MKRLFHGDQDALIHHFQSRRNDAGADDVADGIGRVVDRFEDAQHGAHALRIARQPNPDLGDDGQGSFAADEHAGQIEAGIVFGRAAELDDRAIGQHHFDAQHVIDGDAVFERVRAAGVGGHVAADGAGPLARRIGA